MLKKFLGESFALAAGKPAESLAEFLDTKRYINEFVIAKKLEMTINQTRNVLYKVSEKGLVSSTRKKDNKKGWYTYFWKIEAVKTLTFLRNSFLRKIEQLENQIKSRQTKEFYHCPKCNIEFSEENALLHDFECIECGNILERKDNTKLVSVFEKNLNSLREELKLIDIEIEKEKNLIEKRREREKKKILKEKAEKRAAKREAKKLSKKAEKDALEKKKPAAKKKSTNKKAASKRLVRKKSQKKTAKKKTLKEGTKKTAKKVAKKPTAKKKTVKKTIKKEAKKTGEKLAKKTVKEIAKKPTEKKEKIKKKIIKNPVRKKEAKSIKKDNMRKGSRSPFKRIKNKRRR